VGEIPALAPCTSSLTSTGRYLRAQRVAIEPIAMQRLWSTNFARSNAVIDGDLASTHQDATARTVMIISRQVKGSLPLLLLIATVAFW